MHRLTSLSRVLHVPTKTRPDTSSRTKNAQLPTVRGAEGLNEVLFFSKDVEGDIIFIPTKAILRYKSREGRRRQMTSEGINLECYNDNLSSSIPVVYK